MKLYFNSFLLKLPLLNQADAITLPNSIHFKYSKKDTDPTTIQHELIHVKQKQKIGNIRFYIQYLCEYMRNILIYKDLDQAYRNISFELEAYSLEDSDNVMCVCTECHKSLHPDVAVMHQTICNISNPSLPSISKQS